MADVKEPKLKPTDYTIKLGTEKREFQRGVQIDGKASNLTVSLTLNHNKGLIKVEGKLDNDQITGNSAIDQGTRMSLSGLMAAAEKIGINWRNDWKKRQPKPDPSQIEAPFDE